LLGSIQQPGTPGMLNLGAQARNVHPGFQQSEAEKQRVSFRVVVLSFFCERVFVI
jgi:CCR4-NOT transcription complex subunit 2